MAVLIPIENKGLLNLAKSMDPPGVEPGSSPCEGDVLPLDYRPINWRDYAIKNLAKVAIISSCTSA
jgi:hypothetical protein